MTQVTKLLETAFHDLQATFHGSANTTIYAILGIVGAYYVVVALKSMFSTSRGYDRQVRTRTESHLRMQSEAQPHEE